MKRKYVPFIPRQLLICCLLEHTDFHTLQMDWDDCRFAGYCECNECPAQPDVAVCNIGGKGSMTELQHPGTAASSWHSCISLLMKIMGLFAIVCYQANGVGHLLSA